MGWTLAAATAEMVGESMLAQQREGHRGRTFSFAANQKMEAILGKA